MVSRPPFEYETIPLTGVHGLQWGIKDAAEGLPAADLLVVCVRGGATSTETSETNERAQVNTSFVSYDDATQKVLSQLLLRTQFLGAEGRVVSARAAEAGSRFGDVACLGLGSCSSNGHSVLNLISSRFGSSEGVSPHVASKLGKAIASCALSLKATSVTVVFQSSNLSPGAVQCLLESVLVWGTPDSRFKGSGYEGSPLLESLALVVEGAPATQYEQALRSAPTFAAGEQLARELVNAPANVCTTESLARVAQSLQKQFSFAEIAILDERECKARDMGAYLAVAQGSLYPPQFIHLTYKPPSGEIRKRIALIGKGICMDTGGYNLKVGAGIEQMKFDMGGAAAVLGAARIIGEQRPLNVEVHFIIPAAENMISARASRPGDIVKAYNGMTIEIGNTDAEGRLTLADALAYAGAEVKPDFLVDCATLTGAAMVGLGPSVAGLYGTDPVWTQCALESGWTSGTALWPMPLFTEYRSTLESKLADINNMASSKYGGSINAALFLKEFVPENLPWCHVDMAGPAYDSSSKEGTGYGAKLLAAMVLTVAQQVA